MRSGAPVSGQKCASNVLGGFVGFEQGDSRRGSGEALSIRQMIGQVAEDHGVDSSRLYITDLSFGGAMTSVMLATCPEVFAGGAIIAGLPDRSVDNLLEALVRMKGYGGPSDRRLDALVRGASDYADRRPTISVWHGERDTTVDSSNAGSIVRQ